MGQPQDARTFDPPHAVSLNVSAVLGPSSILELALADCAFFVEGLFPAPRAFFADLLVQVVASALRNVRVAPLRRASARQAPYIGLPA
jgi:hypothetical protein